MAEILVRMDNVTKSFDRNSPPAINSLSATIEAGHVTGLVGPDGAGKTTLLRLVAGLLVPDSGDLSVFDMVPGDRATELRQEIAYMPQRFGLYQDLTVIENLSLYADLRAVFGAEREERIERLLEFTGLTGFTKRLAGALSGGMKQKLGLACALIRHPRLLLLDEPSVGVDPISRRELWQMIYELIDQGIGVVWSTSYLDEAERCATVLLLSEGAVLYDGAPQTLTESMTSRTFHIQGIQGDRRQVLSKALEHPNIIDGVIQGRNVRLVVSDAQALSDVTEFTTEATATLSPVAPRFEDAFMKLVGGSADRGSPFAGQTGRREHKDGVVVEANRLTRRFGQFVAADNISFQVKRGEIFGLIGPNGAGKSTTFKMLCGLLHPSSGSARVAGLDLARASSKARSRLGYMAQNFSLYGELSVRQNLAFFAGVYGLGGQARRDAIERMIDIFGLEPYLDSNAAALPLGFKQRLALACAVMHDPDVLFLDEPTSGVDPRTRRQFWAHINAMVANGVTIMVTTHFLDEAEYCDRVVLIYRGRVIASGAPDELKQSVRSPGRPEPTLEDAFVALVENDDQEKAA